MHAERLLVQIEELKATLKNMRLERSWLMNSILIDQERLDVIKVQANAFEKCKVDIMNEITEMRWNKDQLESTISKLREDIIILDNNHIDVKNQYWQSENQFDKLNIRIQDAKHRKKQLQMDINNLSECKIDLHREQDILKLKIEKEQRKWTESKQRIGKLDDRENELNKKEARINKKGKLLVTTERRLNDFKRELFRKK